MPHAAVAAAGLRHVHPSGRTGLAGVDLTVEAGERVVVLGPNGSGKSTLLAVLSTLLRPGAGRLSLLGRSVPPASPALRRRLGVVRDEGAHLDPLTGRENARLLGRAAGLSRSEIEARLPELLERFALREAADDAVSAWSMGMRRKLLLLEAFLHEPPLLVMDEPSVGLDPPGVDTLVSLVSERSTRGAAVVAALNDPVVAARIGRRVIMLDAGRVVADGSPEALLAELGTGAWCDVQVEGSPAEAARALRDVERVRATAGDGGVEAYLPDGPARLPELVAALVDRGVAIRALRVREPDLGDVFRARTGQHLETGRPT